MKKNRTSKPSAQDKAALGAALLTASGRPMRNDGLPWENPRPAPDLNGIYEEISAETVVDVGRGPVAADSGNGLAQGGLIAVMRHRLKDGKVDDATPRPVDVSEADIDKTFARSVYGFAVPSEITLTWEQRLQAMKVSEQFYREDPIYRGLINAVTYFVIGKGLRFKARDENPAVQQHLEAFWRENKMDGRDAKIVRRFLKFGEVLLRYFATDVQGRPAKVPRLRFIPFWRLADILRDPEDIEHVLAYKIDVPQPGPAQKVNGASSIQYIASNQKTLPAEEFQYISDSDPEEDRAEPYFIGILRACRWYSDWIHNRVVLNRFRSAHVLFKKLIGQSAGRVSGVDSSTPKATSTGLLGRQQIRVPKPGTVVTHNDAIEYDWKAPNVGGADVSPDGQAIRQYIATGAQVPEFILGDASNANYASTFVAENPFIRQIEYLQDFFSGHFREMFKRVIEQGIATGAIPKMSQETTITESGPLMRRVRRVLAVLGIQEANADGDLRTTKAVPTKGEVDIEWPTLLHKDQLDEAQTMQLHQAMGLASLQTLRSRAGYDSDLEKRRIEEEAEESADLMASRRDEEIDGNDGNGDGDEVGGATPKKGLSKPKSEK